MKKIIIFVFSILFIISCNSQNKQDDLYPIKMNNGKYGYINSVGDVIIEPKFYYALDFSEGLAAIREKGFYGYINNTGQFVIPPYFEDAGKFKDGIAIVTTKEDKEIYINTKGEMIDIKLEQYYKLNKFYEGLSIVKTKNGFGYIDTKGNVVISPQYKTASNFENGLALVSKNGSDFGYINKSGKYKIEPKYYLATNFSNGLAAVKDSGYKTKFLNKEGEEILEIKSSYTCDNFSEGLAIFYEEGKGYGYVNKNGDVVIKPNSMFETLISFKEGVARFSTKNEVGYIDKKGNILFKISKDFFLGEVSNGMIPFYKRGESLTQIKYGFMNIKGEIKVKPQFKEVEHFKGNIAGVYLPKGFSDYLYINKEGDIIKPKKY
ncbi:WG repeat-containing protein [Lacinutrix neustonica]|uniref:WG repeat-containing protein n=1 Tax=Lacinutrix neustonica TaxID=2980107 RepID=A0A9E8MYX8_9FLAO|nr:WG repeat-containing protein [Lacinutrix neustonica]WAC03072.1 WG repeat-containing protein [Lacinutrix neustonica]